MFYGRRLLKLDNILRDAQNDGGGGDDGSAEATKDAAKALGFITEEDLEEDVIPDGAPEDEDEEEDEEEEPSGETPEQTKARLKDVQARYQKTLEILGQKAPDLAAMVKAELKGQAPAKQVKKKDEEDEDKAMMDMTPSELVALIRKTNMEMEEEKSTKQRVAETTTTVASQLAEMAAAYELSSEQFKAVLDNVKSMGFDSSTPAGVTQFGIVAATILQNIKLGQVAGGRDASVVAAAEDAARTAALAAQPAKKGATAKTKSGDKELLERIQAVRPRGVDSLFDSNRR